MYKIQKLEWLLTNANCKHCSKSHYICWTYTYPRTHNTIHITNLFQNLSVRLEEVETNAIVGGKRIISKLEARMKDLELELDEEKRRHAETIKILRKKERSLKEVMIQCEEDQKNIVLLQDSLEKTSQKVNIYKRQLTEQVRRTLWFSLAIFQIYSILVCGLPLPMRRPSQNYFDQVKKTWMSCRTKRSRQEQTIGKCRNCFIDKSPALK